MTGAVGEYHVAAELSRRGWLATVTIKNSPGIDVLAQRPESGLTVAIQTKTASPGSLFRLSDKDEQPARGPNEWYVLVRLKEESERPDFFIVPRDFMAAFIYGGHQWWLKQPGKRGPHRDSARRTISGAWIEGFLERWEFLEQPTEVVGPERDRELLERAVDFGLPEGHPWWPKVRRKRSARAT
jgi:hypothetical protein